MNYAQADSQLTGRNRESRKLANNTYLLRRGDDIVIRLHHTNIITFLHNGEVVLNTGGWQTVTTKDRMNRFGGVRIYQKNWDWFIRRDSDIHGEYQPYTDGMRVSECDSLSPLAQQYKDWLTEAEPSNYDPSLGECGPDCEDSCTCEEAKA